MKTMKTMGVWIVVTGFAALIAVSGNTLARDLDDIPGAEDSSASARSSRMDDRRIDDRRMDDVDASARSLRQVKVILLESDSCREGITAG